MKVTALAPWFGSNRMLGAEVGKLLVGCEWVGVPFAGGMSEVAHLKARTVAGNDLHCHVINLAKVVADPKLKDDLVAALEAVPFHPVALREAQFRCDGLWSNGSTLDDPIVNWARDYFVSAWMARNGKAGTKDE